MIPPGYNSGDTSTMKTAVSLPDDLFRLAEAAARRLGVSRSELYANAIAEYLDRETAKIDRLVAKVEAAIERLQEYRAALITAAVTGKIDVRGAAGRAAGAPGWNPGATGYQPR